ncbi:MAG: M18 family aminopeptidase, partial [Firmicutes bacterium]|nr:M18 family aminopeptidase [Bacillota bacterium]
MSDTSRELISFIQASPSVFHAVAELQRRLDEAGFTRLSERRTWPLEKGGKYYVTRNGSSLIAFKVGKDAGELRFQFSAAHCDSPTFRRAA